MNYKPTSFAKSVTVAGTREALKSASFVVRGEFEVCAKVANTNDVFVGGSDVASATGRRLVPGQAVRLGVPGEYTDLSHVFVDATTNGEGVEVTANVRDS
ncbi:MAG: hypothetical protein WBV94_09030 [Blastocatellia bacterium]